MHAGACGSTPARRSQRYLHIAMSTREPRMGVGLQMAGFFGVRTHFPPGVWRTGGRSACRWTIHFLLGHRHGCCLGTGGPFLRRESGAGCSPYLAWYGGSRQRIFRNHLFRALPRAGRRLWDNPARMAGTAMAHTALVIGFRSLPWGMTSRWARARHERGACCGGHRGHLYRCCP